LTQQPLLKLLQKSCKTRRIESITDNSCRTITNSNNNNNNNEPGNNENNDNVPQGVQNRLTIDEIDNPEGGGHTPIPPATNNVNNKDTEKIIGIKFFDKNIKVNVNNKSERSVINLSSHILTPTERSVLEKGLKFCPTPGEPNMNELLEDLRLFFRRMKLKAHFYDPSEMPLENQSTIPDFFSHNE